MSFHILTIYNFDSREKYGEEDLLSLISDIKDDYLKISGDCRSVELVKLYQWYQKYILCHKDQTFQESNWYGNLNLLISGETTKVQKSSVSLSTKIDKVLLINTSSLLAPILLKKLNLKSWILTVFNHKTLDFNKTDICTQNCIKFDNKIKFGKSIWNVSIWDTGLDNAIFDFSNCTSNSDKIWPELGNSLWEITEITAQSVVVIFPNYEMMNDWIYNWNKNKTEMLKISEK